MQFSGFDLHFLNFDISRRPVLSPQVTVQSPRWFKRHTETFQQCKYIKEKACGSHTHTEKGSIPQKDFFYKCDPVASLFFLPFDSSLLRVVDGPGCFLAFSSISSSLGLSFCFLFSSFFRMKAKTQTDEYKSYQPALQHRKRGQSGQFRDTLVPNHLLSKWEPSMTSPIGL